MHEVETTQAMKIENDVDTKSKEFRVAQSHMSLRAQLRMHGVPDEVVDVISEQIEVAIEEHTELDIHKVCGIEAEFLEIWYPDLGGENPDGSSKF